jgi:hypothetical protein
MVVFVDDLFPEQVTIDELKKARISFILVAKPIFCIIGSTGCSGWAVAKAKNVTMKRSRESISTD